MSKRKREQVKRDVHKILYKAIEKAVAIREIVTGIKIDRGNDLVESAMWLSGFTEAALPRISEMIIMQGIIKINLPKTKETKKCQSKKRKNQKQKYPQLRKKTG